MSSFLDRWEKSEERTRKFFNRVVVLDTETGGLHPDVNAILEVALINGDSCLEVRVNDENGLITQEALEYNGLNLEVHRAKAMTPFLAARAVKNWLEALQRRHGSDRLWLCGQNVGFDVGFMHRLFDQAGMAVPPLFSTYRIIDTHCLLWERVARGVLPDNCCSLDGALDHFGIEVKERHTAMGDAKGTHTLLAKLLEVDS